MLNPTHNKKNAQLKPHGVTIPVPDSQNPKVCQHTVGEVIGKQILSYIAGNRAKLYNTIQKTIGQCLEKLLVDLPPLTP